MPPTLGEDVPPPSAATLARVFSRLGWIGLWVQVAVGGLSALLMIYLFVFSSSPSGLRVGLRLVQYLTIVGLLMLIFTTFWSYRYTRLAKRIVDPQSQQPKSSLIRIVWTGVVGCSLGIVLSIMVLLIEASQLLFYFLATPQVGVPVFQNPGTGSASWVSAADMVSLMCLILTLTGEIAVLFCSLWLLFRVMQPGAGFDARLAAGGSP